jgi:hypothetical protein
MTPKRLICDTDPAKVAVQSFVDTFVVNQCFPALTFHVHTYFGS